MLPRRRFGLHPAQTVVVGFATAILVGTLLLLLPISAKDGRSPSFIDALFTATSAVCVTRAHRARHRDVLDARSARSSSSC